MAFESVSCHPKSAIEAWSRIVPLDLVGKKDNQYLNEWRMEDAYSGLQRGVPDSLHVLNPNVVQPSSFREQLSIASLVKMVPDAKAAQEKACVAAYDTKMTKDQQAAHNTKCGLFQTCISLNAQTGELESAGSLAKKAFQKEKKGALVRGFCGAAIKIGTSNIGNKAHNSEELQHLRDQITQLQARERELRGEPELTTDTPCTSATSAAITGVNPPAGSSTTKEVVAATTTTTTTTPAASGGWPSSLPGK